MKNHQPSRYNITALHRGLRLLTLIGDILDFFVDKTQVVYFHVYQAVAGANGGSSPYYLMISH